MQHLNKARLAKKGGGGEAGASGGHSKEKVLASFHGTAIARTEYVRDKVPVPANRGSLYAAQAREAQQGGHHKRKNVGK